MNQLRTIMILFIITGLITVAIGLIYRLFPNQKVAATLE